MQAEQSSRSRDARARSARRLGVVTLGTVAALAVNGARADEPTPWYVGASEKLTHDSNVFRSPNERSDNYSSTGLLGGFDQRISRQRVYGKADLHYEKFQNFSQLDNTGYGVAAGWDWATIETLSGNINASANQSLASRNGNEYQPSEARNLAKSDQIGASVRWGGAGRLSLDASYSHSRVRYTAVESLPSESTTDSGSVGAWLRLGESLRLGTAVRVARTYSPYGIVIPGPTITSPPAGYEPNTRKSRNLDFLADWRYSAQSAVNARISYTRETNSGATGLDFSGLTGSISAQYAPTAKLAFGATLARDTGSQIANFSYNVDTGNTGTFPAVTTISGIAQNRRTTDSLVLSGKYFATAKITANAELAYRRGKLADYAESAFGSATAQRTDTLRSASLGADWAIARHWLLACELTHESRSVSGIAGFAYSADVASCSAQYTLR